MAASVLKPVQAMVNRWGNGLAERITKSVAETAGLHPKRHDGEVMGLRPAEREVL